MEIQLAYAIGVADPVSIRVNTFGTSELSNDILLHNKRNISFKPKDIINSLDLLYQFMNGQPHMVILSIRLNFWEKLKRFNN